MSAALCARGHHPASRSALVAARPSATLKRSEKVRAGLAWARDWRARNAPMFDAMEAAGLFAPARAR